MFFKSNIKLLRDRKNLSQELVALALEIKRSSLNNYENGYAEPKLDVLNNMARYYHVSIDTLLNVDLSKLSEFQLRELEAGHDTYIKGNKLRVLATTVDKKNKDNIELVPIKAKAGYTNGYNDPEFISRLPIYQLPFLHKERKYRTFQIEGDSMKPIPHGAYITCEFVSNWKELRNGTACIVVTREEGIVFKLLHQQEKNAKKILLESLNSEYSTYELALSDILEVWKFSYYASSEIPDQQPEKDELIASVVKLQKEVQKMISLNINK